MSVIMFFHALLHSFLVSAIFAVHIYVPLVLAELKFIRYNDNYSEPCKHFVNIRRILVFVRIFWNAYRASKLHEQKGNNYG